MQRQIRIGLLAGFTLVAALVSGAAYGAETGVIYGLVYISPPGDLSYDVMFGSGLEVRLLRGDSNLETELKALKKKRLEQIKAQDEVRQKALGEFRAAAFAFEKDPKRIQKTRETLRQESEKLRTLRADYKKEVDTLLAGYTLQKVTTGQDGKFRFEGLSAGRYFLHTQFEILRTTRRFVWLHPVELKDGSEQQVDLTKLNAINLYYGR